MTVLYIWLLLINFYAYRLCTTASSRALHRTIFMNPHILLMYVTHGNCNSSKNSLIEERAQNFNLFASFCISNRRDMVAIGEDYSLTFYVGYTACDATKNGKRTG